MGSEMCIRDSSSEVHNADSKPKVHNKRRGAQSRLYLFMSILAHLNRCVCVALWFYSCVSVLHCLGGCVCFSDSLACVHDGSFEWVSLCCFPGLVVCVDCG